MKEEKEIRANIAVALQPTKIIATVHGECLVKMEKALNVPFPSPGDLPDPEIEHCRCPALQADSLG